MRLWSIHPRYLDSAGLVAVWREGLLAQKVLLGETRGYRFHPQLLRFRDRRDPLLAIGCYLREILNEADRRGYRFDAAKIMKTGQCRKMPVHRGQIEYEWQHLLGKLEQRDPDRYAANCTLIRPQAHPGFRIVPGGVEAWV